MNAFEPLDDDALLGLLLTTGDRLPREAVDEAARRGERLVLGLRAIIEDGHNWDRVDAGWWSVVHAVHILGCIKGEAATAALLEAFDRGAGRDHDWLFEEWPSILGRRGPEVLEALRNRIDDIFAGVFWIDRAICSMAAVASRHPERRAEVFGYLAELLADEDYDPEARVLAAHVFLDFRLKEHKEILLYLATHPDNDHFKASEVHESLALDEPDLQWYQHDWLEFYLPKRIAERQERWESERPSEEDAWWYALADLADEEFDEEIPGRKKAKSALNACLPLADRLREASETYPEDCPHDRLPGFAALALEAGVLEGILRPLDFLAFPRQLYESVPVLTQGQALIEQAINLPLQLPA